METDKVPAHNFWRQLAEAERPPVDQMRGIRIQMLKKGDTVTFATTRGSDGYATLVTLEVTNPNQGGVRIVRAVRFLGGLRIEVAKESFGRGIAGVFVVRGDKHDGRDPELGWIGMGADVCLTGDITFRSVRNIFVNDTFVSFPQSSETIQ